MSWDFRHHNGELDSSTHKHAWQVLDGGEFKPAEVTQDMIFCWCALCGAAGQPIKKLISLPSFEYGKNDLRHQVIKQGHKEIVAKLMDMATKAFVSGQDNDARVLRTAAKELGKEE